MSQTAVSERLPISSPFQWGSCQTITADTHHNSLGENQYWKGLHKLITTSHCPWGGSAVPKPYRAEICLTCCYKHWKVRMLGSVEAWHSSSPSSSLQHLSGVTGLLFVMSYPLWPLNIDKESQLQKDTLNLGLSYMQHLSPHLVLSLRHWPKRPGHRSTARCSQHWEGCLPLTWKAFGVFSCSSAQKHRMLKATRQTAPPAHKRSLRPCCASSFLKEPQPRSDARALREHTHRSRLSPPAPFGSAAPCILQLLQTAESSA